MGPFYADEQLDELIHHWGSAYRISNPEAGVWVAQRRDTGATLRAAGPDALYAAISRDYTGKKVPREAG